MREQVEVFTGLLATGMQSFLVSSRHCSFIASVQLEEKERREAEEKRIEAVGAGGCAGTL